MEGILTVKESMEFDQPDATDRPTNQKTENKERSAQNNMNIPTYPFKSKFADSSPTRVSQLINEITGDVNHENQGQGKPFSLKTYHRFTALLPCLKQVNEAFKHSYNITVLDTDVKNDLQQSKVINWCRTSKVLYPIKTRGDGNCLLHAVSLFLWGMEDRDLLLRRLLYLSLANDDKKFFRRWLTQYRNTMMDQPEFELELNSKDMDREWTNILKSAEDNPVDQGTSPNFHTLEGIHLYVLANILRRPIIVLADRKVRSVYGHSVQSDSLGGIYLPLEWKPAEVCKSPITIAYSMNHFCPLLPQRNVHDGRATDSEYVIPLVYYDFEPLVLRFLLYAEESLGHDLLNGYLDTKNIPMTTSDSILEIPVAKSNYQIIKPAFDIVQSHFEECQQIYRMWIRDREVQTGQPQLVSTVVTSQVSTSHTSTNPHQLSTKCHTPGCDLFGSPAYGGKCSECFNKYTVDYNRQETERRNQALVEPSAPLASMPYLPSGNYCELSIMDENCKNFAKCGNKMSVHKYPFCHECRPDDNLPSHPVGQEMSSSPPRAVRNEPVDDSRLFGEGDPLRPLNLKTIVPNQTVLNSSRTGSCVSPNCKNQEHPNHKNFCKECYSKLQSGTLSASGQEGPSSQTYLMNTEGGGLSDGDPSGGTPSPGDTSIKPFEIVGNKLGQEQIQKLQNQGKCKFGGCESYGHVHYKGYCEPCYKKITSPEEMLLSFQHVQEQRLVSPNQLKRLCSIPGCKEEKIKNDHGLCFQCYLKNKLPVGEVSKEPIPPPDNSTLESKTPLDTAEIPQPRIVTSSREKVKCVSPLCDTLIYPPHHLCERCKAILQREYAESNRSRSLEVNRHRPARQGSAYSPSRHKCQTENCEYYGDKKFHGYCSNCYQVAVTTAPIRTAKPEVVPRQNNTAPHLRQSMNCVEPGCDKFGDPSMSNRCTEHYRQAMRRPPPPHSSPFLLPFQVEQYNVAEKDRNTAVPLPPEHYNIPVTNTNTGKSPLGGSQYIQAMQKVEGSRKGNKCKSASCDNYGNSSNQGYCNACFKERTSGGNDRVQGNYMCC